MPNIHDVARRAGVSPVTVSRVVNGAPNVHVETRARVERAIRELGYLPNLAARSLRARQTRTLALIVPDITNAFWTTVSRGVEDAAQSDGYSVLLCNTDENPAKQTSYLETVLRQRVDGVILAPCDADLSRLARLPEHNTPAVLVDRRVPGWMGDTVYCDSLAAARALTAHLLSLGRRRIAVITGPVGASTADDRIAGYAQALHQAGLSFDERLVRRGEYRTRSGKVLTRALLNEDLHPDAFLAANNALAMGVLEALYERGMRVPQDVALVCFDDLPDVSHFYPFLSVAVQPAYDIGLNAAQLLLSRIDAEGPLQPRRVILPVRLVLRYSCGRLLDQAAYRTEGLGTLPDRTEIRLVRREGGEAGDGEGEPAAPGAFLPRALRGQTVERPACIELGFPSRAVLEYALQRSLGKPLDAWNVAPADWVSYARQVGVDAIPCALFPPQAELPPVSALLNRLEGYLRAAQGSGVGVYAIFPLPAWMWQPGALLKPLQEQVRVIVDRFAGELAMLMFTGLREPDAQAGTLAGVFAGLLAPAKEHGLTTAVRLPVEDAALLDTIAAAGVNLLLADGWPHERVQAARSADHDRLAWGLGLEGGLLVQSEGEAARALARETCAEWIDAGGTVLGLDPAQGPVVFPEVYVQVVRAVREFSR